MHPCTALERFGRREDRQHRVVNRGRGLRAYDGDTASVPSFTARCYTISLPRYGLLFATRDKELAVRLDAYVRETPQGPRALLAPCGLRDPTRLPVQSARLAARPTVLERWTLKDSNLRPLPCNGASGSTSIAPRPALSREPT